MKQGIFFILLATFITACIADFEKDLDKIGQPKWNPEVGLPVLSGTFSLEDYVDASSDVITMSQDDDGVIIIEYTGDAITSDYAEDLIDVPAQSFYKALRLTSQETIDFPISGTFNKSFTVDNDIEVEDGATDELDSIFLKAGSLVIEITPNLPADGEIDLTINTLKIDGQPIKLSTSWTYDPMSPTPQPYTETIDLTGVFGDFTKNGTAINNFNFDADVSLTYSGQPVSPNHRIGVSINIIDPAFQLVFGKFSERSFDTELEAVALGLFDEVDIEGFYLDDPKIEFNFKSSYGVPVQAEVLALDAINSQGDLLPFSGSAISDPTDLPGPDFSQVGEYIETSFLIDKSNSNITDIISFLPTELEYQFSGTVLSSDPGTVQFVLDTSRVIGGYTVSLPLDGSVIKFSSEQELSMESNEIDELGESKIVLKSLNGLPITVLFEISFYDEFDNEILTLFKDAEALKPGEIDSNGFVTNPTENILEQTLSETEIRDVLGATKAIIRTTLNTGETGLEVVKFRMTDEVTLSLYVQTSLLLFE